MAPCCSATGSTICAASLALFDAVEALACALGLLAAAELRQPLVKLVIATIAASITIARVYRSI
jgi:hypothetical protein